MSTQSKDEEIRGTKYAYQHITAHEGPRTPFVLISRACHLSATYPHQAENCANALFLALTEMGCLNEGKV